MPERDYRSVGGLSKVVERQVRNWELARSQKIDNGSARKQEVEDFVTIANICGAGGNEVAALLSEKLNWPLFDRQILSVMAGDDEVRARLYETMDERDLGWIENTFRSLMQSEFRRNDYFYRLTETLLCLASQGHAVFVGRSADLILPKNKGLRVKIVASLERCAQNFAQYNDCSIEQARRKIARIEKERKDFIWNHFHIDAYEPSRFDMFINLERFTNSQAVDMILLVLKLRGIQY